MKTLLIILFLVLSFNFGFTQENEPVIDIHLHAYEAVKSGIPASWAGEKDAKVLTSPANAETHLQLSLAQMEKHNIVLAVVSSTSINAIEQWKQAAPGLFLGGIQTNDEGMPIVGVDSLKTLKEKGVIDVFGELGLQYAGVSPDDPRLEPYYEVAEENNIPVCLHTGLGPPGAPHTFAPKFRTTLGKPTLFEPVLVRHPNLKAFLAHAGWPYISETIAMMYIYPDLHADIGVLTWALPKEAYYSAVKQFMDAGFGKRILFGTDQMMWSEAIGIAVQTVKNTPFLSEEEKRDILYYNAARFLGLSEETIARHHGILSPAENRR